MNLYEVREGAYGFAVMTSDLSAYCFESIHLDDCKRVCDRNKGYVVAERIPMVSGVSVKIDFFNSFSKPLRLRKTPYKNILWLHWQVWKRYRHKTGEIVYRPKETECPST